MPQILTVCPECGADLTKQDHRAHALSHWPEMLPDIPEYREARARQRKLMESYELVRRQTAVGG